MYNRFKVIPFPSAIQIANFSRVQGVKIALFSVAYLNFGYMPKPVARAFGAANYNDFRTLACCVKYCLHNVTYIQ